MQEMTMRQLSKEVWTGVAPEFILRDGRFFHRTGVAYMPVDADSEQVQWLQRATNASGTAVKITD